MMRMPPAEYHPLYLGGIERFNRRDYFESHEVWEDLWNVECGPAKRFYQGLIQAAVALHHLTNGNHNGADKLLARCCRHLGPYRPKYMGLDVERFLAELAECCSSQPEGRGCQDRVLLERVPQIALDAPASEMPHAEASRSAQEGTNDNPRLNAEFGRKHGSF
jgi:uncharacterized protein